MRRITLVAMTLLFVAARMHADGTAAHIDSISPLASSYRGGVTVTIKGRFLIAHGCVVNVECRDPAVLFGNEKAEIVSANDSQIVVRNPPHRHGAVDVTVIRADGGSASWNAAFQYQAPNYVLLPLILRESAGANGSRWTTETTIVNRSANSFLLTATGMRIEPRSIVRNPFSGESAPSRIIHPPYSLRDRVTIHLRARDLSRQASTLGVEIPVVNPEDYFVRELSLAAIPTDPAFRVALRIYQVNDFDDGGRVAQEYRLRIYASADDRAPIVDTLVAVDTPFANAHPFVPDYPALFQNHNLAALFPAVTSSPEVRLLIEPVNIAPGRQPLFWAFVSVTHNESQHVTLVTPD